MRIHELLEASLNYVAFEGVLGSDPLVVRAHLHSLDPHVDEAFFAHLWPLLARHQCLQVVIGADDLPGLDTAPENSAPTTLAPPPNDEAEQHRLFRKLGDDDGCNPPVRVDNLPALLERYPHRIRLRCTDDEIYYRLTGSRQRISKITSKIFLFLLLAARAREQGVSALELGPVTGSSQNSVFHYIKVLTQLGLCAKIPAYLHGSYTNVLVHRRFLVDNPHYKAHMRRDERQDDKEESARPEPEVDPEDEDVEGKAHSQDLGFNFAPFSLLELTAGHIPKERLLRVLDHPGLKNHLLGNHHLLQVVGWSAENWATRHRRMLQRHIAQLVEEGIVEYVDIGPAARACLRLTKYNPDFVPKPEVVVEKRAEVPLSVEDYAEPFQYIGGAKSTQSIEAQMLQSIANSGSNGRTMADLALDLSGEFKRTLEHIINKHDLVYLPPHLRRRSIRCVIESHQRERRLRVFTTSAYAESMAELGQAFESSASTGQEGHFADLSYRRLGVSREDYIADAEDAAASVVPLKPGKKGRPSLARADTPGGTPRPPRTPTAKKSGRPKKEKVIATPTNKYDNEVQERGRPRKYIYIVDEDGTRNRRLIPDIPTTPDLPMVLIYVKDEDLLVPAPRGYTGVGKPPTLTEEQIATGKPPDFYLSLPGANLKRKGGKGLKTSVKRKKKDVDDEEDAGEGEERNEDGGEETPQAGPSKKRPRKKAPAAEAEVVDSDTPMAGVEDASGIANETPTATPSKPPVRRGRPRRSVVAAAEAAAAAALSASAEEEGEAPTPAVSALEPDVNEVAAVPAPEPVDPLPEPIPEAVPDMAQESAPPPEVSTPVEPALPPAPALSEPAETAPPAALATSPKAPIKSEIISPLVTTTALPQDGEGAEAGDEAPQDGDVTMSVDDASEPLVEIKESKPKNGQRGARVDIAVLRRQNQVFQCLADCGGVMGDQKLWAEHTAWSHRVAGTNHPNAPSVAASMDRKVFRRTLNSLIADGRIKERIATIPMTTGRWVKTNVVYVVDLEEPEVQAYIRSLANSAAGPSTPSPVARSKASLKYSVYRRPTPRSMAMSMPTEDPQSPSNRAFTRRETLLLDGDLASYLYGFQTGRNLRAKRLMSAITSTFTDDPDTKSIVSRSPRVFAIPMIHEDLKVKDYVALVPVRHFDQELYDWLQIPENLDLPLRNVPYHIRRKAHMVGKAGSAIKGVVRTLVSLLCFLQQMVPLRPSDHSSGLVHCPDAHEGHPTSFERCDVNTATYFMLYDVVPIYHLGDVAMPCIGFMHQRTPLECEYVWEAVQEACIVGHQAPFIRRIEVPSFPWAPDSGGVLEQSPDQPRILRARLRWRHDIRLTLEQRESLNTGLDIPGCRRVIVAPEEVAQLAYDNALRADYVEAYLDRRIRELLGEQAAEPAFVSQKNPLAVRTKRQQEKNAIREELAERIRTARKVYDDRVKAAAERAQLEVTQELLNYLTHNRPMSRLGEIVTDHELSAIIESYQRVKAGFAPPRRATVALRSAPTIRATKRGKLLRERKGKADAKLRRHRHIWTKEDEDLVMDAEAVIRARCRGTTMRGRAAMVQLFPNIGEQVLRTKVKKMLDQPGRNMYFDRMVDAWHNLWLEKRGTDELPDPNPDSHIDFDLRAHVDYMRDHINKNLLRMPVAMVPTKGHSISELPLDPGEIISQFKWDYLKQINTSFEQLMDGSGNSEDNRLHNISMGSIVDGRVTSFSPFSMFDRRTGVVRAVLKMIVATPPEIYSMRDAGELLSFSPKHEHERMIAALVNEGVLNKTSANMKTPGRMYSFTLTWSNLCEGGIPSDFDEELDKALERFDNPQQSCEWPLIGHGGDLAALMSLVSSHSAEFDFDVADFPVLRQGRLSYNTRALNDDAFEFEFSVTRKPETPRPTDKGFPQPREFPRLVQWASTHVTACTRADVDRILDAVDRAGEAGLPRSQMEKETRLSPSVVDGVLATLAADPICRVFWAGYDTPRLVSRNSWTAWTVAVSPRAPDTNEAAEGAEKVEALPRRWNNIWGEVIPSEFRKAVKSVVGQIMFRPGITEDILFSHLASTLDRLEICDVLQYMIDKAIATRERVHGGLLPPVQATGEGVARQVVWRSSPALWA